MKKLLISTAAVGMLFAQPTLEQLQKQIQLLQEQLQELKAAQQKTSNSSLKKEIDELKASQEETASNLQKVKQAHYDDHINWHFDLRSTLDQLNYKTKSGKSYANSVLTNRVQLFGMANATDNLKANVALQATNVFGMNGNSGTSLTYQNSNWTGAESPDDTTVRVKEAYFMYFFDDGKYMFSAGRRPTIDPYPANLIVNDTALSNPIAHTVNMEFDGFSFTINNSALPEFFSDYGTNIKFCAGRGYSANQGQYSANGAPYSRNDKLNTNFGGFLLTPYTDGQYTVEWQNFYASNVMGYTKAGDTTSMDNLGDALVSNLIFKANGIGGDDASDFMLDTQAFISLAYSKTMPDAGKKMLGSSSNKNGYSIWIGASMDGFGDSDTWGINYVHGSKYFRPFTYAEDTLAGSIAAVRGDAFDIYYNKQIVEHLSAQLRGTYFNYKYAGSNAFFGENGNPDASDFVKHASDIRAYIRYQY
ncbi:MAG: DUF3373 domain-containing protein [Nautilia sp.]|nr:MAG: DUF3373 domain-containing protein [Nautilia sp.]